MRKSNSSRIDPCETPPLAFCLGNVELLRATVCFLSLKISDLISSRLPNMSFCYNMPYFSKRLQNIKKIHFLFQIHYQMIYRF